MAGAAGVGRDVAARVIGRDGLRHRRGELRGARLGSGATAGIARLADGGRGDERDRDEQAGDGARAPQQRQGGGGDERPDDERLHGRAL